MRKLKNILLIVAVLTLALLFTPAIPGAGDEVNAATEGWTAIGTCRYQIRTTGTGESQEVTLTIAPKEGQSTGILPEGISSASDWPWDSERANITKVVIEPGVRAGDSVRSMFCGFTSLTDLDLTNLDTSNTTNMCIFVGSDATRGSMKLKTIRFGGKFTTAKVQNMTAMFQLCPVLTELDLSTFDTSNVTSMLCMFDGCTGLKVLDLSSFDTGKVTNMTEMFKGETDSSGQFIDADSSLETIIVNPDKWSTESVNSSSSMFQNCPSLVGGAGTPYSTGNVDASYAKLDGGTTDPGYLSCKVTFDMNGHGTAPDFQVAGIGSKVKKPDEPFVPGYNFGGWYKEKTCRNYWNFETDTVKGTTILYAKWNAPAQCFIAKAKSGRTHVKYTWNKVDGAKYYKVFFAQCGNSRFKTIKNTTATSFTKKKLKAKRSYKAYVVACTSRNKVIARTPLVHVMTKGGKYSNATKVTAKKTLAITACEKAKLGAKIAKKDSKKKLVNHCASLRYYSADKTIAKVSSKGVVTGVKAGATHIYAVAPNGYYIRCKVVIKKPTP